MDLPSLFAQTEQQYGLPAGYLQRTAQIESSLNPAAKNPNSSAAGLFQFIDSTARQYGLADPFDPIAATDAAARLARDNAAHLSQALGRAPSAAELYLAHQQGAGGAASLLSNPGADASGIVGSAAVGLNGGSAGMNAGDFAGQWLSKFGGGGAPTAAPVMGNPISSGGPLPMTSAGPDMGAVMGMMPGGSPQPGGMMLGDIAAQYLTGQQQKMAARREEQAAEEVRRAALLGGGVAGLYG